MIKHYICDTNVIIRYLVKDDPKLFDKLSPIFDQVRLGEVKLQLEQTVITEVVFVLSSFYQIPRAEIAEALSELLTYKGIITEKDVFISALEIYKNTNLHIVDCILVTKSQLCDTELLSFDKKLNSIVSNKELMNIV